MRVPVAEYSGTSFTPLELYQFTQLTDYVAAGSFALFLYDYLLTVYTEVQFVWFTLPKPSTLTTFYFVARYTPLFYFVLFAYGLYQEEGAKLHRVIYIQEWLGLITIAACEGILMTRTWALWSRDRRILVFLGFAYAAALATSIVLLALLATGFAPEYVLYIMVVVSETVIIAFTSYRCHQYCRRGTLHSFMKAVYRDGVSYYACILAISAINLALQLRYPRAPVFLADIQLVMHSILCTRVVLHLRDFRLPSDHAHGDSTELTDMRRMSKTCDTDTRIQFTTVGNIAMSGNWDYASQDIRLGETYQEFDDVQLGGEGIGRSLGLLLGMKVDEGSGKRNLQGSSC